MTTSYDAPASPQCLATHETQDEPPRVSFLRALAALLTLIPGLGDVHFGTESRYAATGPRRWRLQVARMHPDTRSNLELMCGWAEALGLDRITVGNHPGHFTATALGDLDGHLVEVWTCIDELAGSDIPTGTEIPVAVLRDAELHVAGGLPIALAHLGYPAPWDSAAQDADASGEDGQK